MQQQSSASGTMTATVTQTQPLVEFAPELITSQSPQARMVTMHLISTQEMPSCPFWLGIFQHGKVKAVELFEEKQLDQLFHRAAAEGLNESEAVMLTESRLGGPRSVYLIPAPANGITQRASWIHQISSTAKAWGSGRIGIFLAPEIFSHEDSQELLMQLMRELVQSSPTREYFFIPGTHGLNAALNTALRVKGELERNDLEIYVFH